jgi:hypothetical protein
LGFLVERPLAALARLWEPNAAEFQTVRQLARALFFLGTHAERNNEWDSARLSPERVTVVLSEAKAA